MLMFYDNHINFKLALAPGADLFILPTYNFLDSLPHGGFC